MGAFDGSQDLEARQTACVTSAFAQEAVSWRSEKPSAGARTIVSRQGRPIPVICKPRTTRNARAILKSGVREL